MNNSVFKNSDFYKLLHCAFTEQKISHARFETSGNSMHPFIKNRDIIVLHSALKKETIKVGDVVAVVDRKKKWFLFVHRVIRIKAGLCQTKGDNNKKDDGWVSLNDILGVVIKTTGVSGKTYLCKRWYNFTIAIISRSGLLNFFILPALFLFLKLLKPSQTRV